MANSKNSRDFLVSTANVAFYYDDMLAFTGTTSLNTSISVSMEDEEIRGGKGDKLLYKYKYGREFSSTIEMAEWRLEFIAAQVGSTIFEGLKEVYQIAECVTLTDGIGTLEKTPIGNVAIEIGDGSIEEITPEGNTITVAADVDKVLATYKFSADVKRVTVDADSTPFVGRLVMSADKHNNQKGKVGEVQIEVPSFQLSGTFDISMESTGAASTSMEGDALAVAGDSCEDGDVYAYITEISTEEMTSSVSEIAVIPAIVNLEVGGTQALSVIGIKGGLYSNIAIEAADCEFTSDDESVATVSEDGIVAGVAEGETLVTAEYDGCTDIVSVAVGAGDGDNGDDGDGNGNDGGDEPLPDEENP